MGKGVSHPTTAQVEAPVNRRHSTRNDAQSSRGVNSIYGMCTRCQASPRLSRPLTGAPLRLDKILRIARGLTGSKG